MREVIVVKCGGHAAVDPAAVCADIADLAAHGWPVVLVHGGSADIDRLGRRLGVAPRQLTSPDGIVTRHTDEATLEVVQLALSGLVKPRLVTALVTAGVTAVGMTGLDGGLLRARRKAANRAAVGGRTLVVRDVHSGRVTSVNTELLHLLLTAAIVPVVSPPALAEDGRPVNADADRVAAAVAVALGARTLILLTGAPGVLADPSDEASLVSAYKIPATGTPPQAGRGIGLKLVAAREALIAGVPQVLVADGRGPDPVQAALSGKGTRMLLDAPC